MFIPESRVVWQKIRRTVGTFVSIDTYYVGSWLDALFKRKLLVLEVHICRDEKIVLIKVNLYGP